MSRYQGKKSRQGWGLTIRTYRLIGKLTAFLQFQEFSQRNQTWELRAFTFAARLSWISLSQKLTLNLLQKMREYVRHRALLETVYSREPTSVNGAPSVPHSHLVFWTASTEQVTRSSSRNLMYWLRIKKEFFTTPFLWLTTLLGFPNITMRIHNGTEERGFDYRVKKARIYVQIHLQITSSSRRVLRIRP